MTGVHSHSVQKWEVIWPWTVIHSYSRRNNSNTI